MMQSCGNDAMLRQMTEVILIQELTLELNTKDEWGNPKVLSEKDHIWRDDLPNSFEESIVRMWISNNSH